MKGRGKKGSTGRPAGGRREDGLPFVSVVVSTIGRGRLLIETVEGLLSSDYPACEIVVIDQTPAPAGDVIEFMHKNVGRVRYIRKERPGLPEARNAGVRHARGDVILFVDDDVIPDRRLIAAHARAYADGGVGGVAGRVLAPDGPPGKVERRQSRIAKIGLSGLLIRDNFNADVPTEAHHARGCNMSFAKDAILEAGGFDGRFGGSAHLEETDLAVRVRAAGRRLVFEPHASLVHLLEPAGGCRPKNLHDWFYWYGHNVRLFYLKNFPKMPRWLLAAYFSARLLFSAAKNREPRVLLWGIRGFFAGAGTYRAGRSPVTGPRGEMKEGS